jgi:hypothetical protein
MLNRGDLVLFRGDLVHAGAAMQRFNFRIHMFLDVVGVRRHKGVTYYMDGNAGHSYILPLQQQLSE